MLSSDEEAFGGFENLSKKYDTEFVSTAGDYDNRPHSLQVVFHHLLRLLVIFLRFCPNRECALNTWPWLFVLGLSCICCLIRRFAQLHQKRVLILPLFCDACCVLSPFHVLKSHRVLWFRLNTSSMSA